MKVGIVFTNGHVRVFETASSFIEFVQDKEVNMTAKELKAHCSTVEDAFRCLRDHNRYQNTMLLLGWKEISQQEKIEV